MTPRSLKQSTTNATSHLIPMARQRLAFCIHPTPGHGGTSGRLSHALLIDDTVVDLNVQQSTRQHTFEYHNLKGSPLLVADHVQSPQQTLIYCLPSAWHSIVIQHCDIRGILLNAIHILR